MAKQRHLKNAPITEALVDFRVEPRHALTFAELQQAFSDLDFGYYLKNAISQGTFGFRMTQDGIHSETTFPPEQIGLRLHSADEKYVAQCGIRGFTISRLPPYEDWQTLVSEARRIWSIYTTRLAPVRVTRIATRFINNLRLPLDTGTSFQIYLHKFADVPDEAPQSMTAFFQRFQLIDSASGARVNLTIALESTPPIAPVPVILDVDAFFTQTFNLDEAGMWSALEQLHELKNQCFFGSLTEQAVGLYE